MTEADKIGLLANLERCKAQERINLGLYDQTDYIGVRALYLLAFGRKSVADRAASQAAERKVYQDTEAARARR